MGLFIEIKNQNTEIKRCISSNRELGEQKVTIGNGQESHLVIDDPSWVNLQFEIFSKENKYFLKAHKCEFLTLYKISPNEQILVTLNDLIILGNSEGFVIMRCCGTNNINKEQKKEILEVNSHIIHPKINEPPEVLGNSTDPKLILRFIKGQYIGRVYEYTTKDKIAFGREELANHHNIIFSSNLISAQHLIMFFDLKYECWMVKEATEKGSLNCSYLALTTNSTVNRVNRQQNISPDFYLAMGTECEFITANTYVSVIFV